MDALIRAGVIYAFLLALFRISGKRTLSQMTTFDFVLLLVVAEATQQGLLGDDYSLTNAMIVVLALIGLDIAISFVKQKSPAVDRVLEGLPVVIVDDGVPRTDLMKRLRVDVADVLAAARERQGLERLDQIKYAVLERSGGISSGPSPGGVGPGRTSSMRRPGPEPGVRPQPSCPLLQPVAARRRTTSAHRGLSTRLPA